MEAFFGDRLDASAGAKTFRDKTGNCRLKWFDEMLRHPVKSIDASERFTRELHNAVRDSKGAREVIRIASEKLDADGPPGKPLPPRADNAADLPLAALVGAIQNAQTLFDRALAKLNESERKELEADLYPQSTGKAEAPFFAEGPKSRRVCDLLEKLDRTALLRSGIGVAEVSEERTFKQLTDLAIRHLKGQPQAELMTEAGRILFGGPGNNEYRLDDLGDVCAVIDVGGNDTYIEGSLTSKRRVLVIVDLAGNDSYRGTKPGIQGGAILGVSVLVDVAGDDSYSAVNVAQGAALGGIGILVDRAGNDKYLGDKRAQGAAVGGVGALLDLAGDDDYRVALLGQGAGGPLGFALLDDVDGKDHYYAGGKYPDNYDDSPGYSGWSQGVGVGPRGTANGGIGVLLDGGGDDLYEADYFSHAGGYWFALGFCRDFGGNDQRIGSTRTAFSGAKRTEPRFMRYGNGFGVHYAAGYLIDDAGDDLYGGDHACTGFTWDVGMTAILDFGGNDKYEVTSSGGGACYNGGVCVLFDQSGNDVYNSPSLGDAAAKSDYHAEEPRSHNFSFIIDLAGDDKYSGNQKNGKETEKGWAGGMLIDR